MPHEVWEQIGKDKDDHDHPVKSYTADGLGSLANMGLENLFERSVRQQMRGHSEQAILTEVRRGKILWQKHGGKAQVVMLAASLIKSVDDHSGRHLRQADAAIEHLYDWAKSKLFHLFQTDE